MLASVRRGFGARPQRTLLLLAAYALVTLVMTRPYVNYESFGTASYEGDARLIIWTLAWGNHARLSGEPFFQSNVFFPDPDSLRYNEHLFGLGLFTLPWAAAGLSPVLAYNVVWWLTFLLNGLAAFFLLRRFVGDDLSAFAGSLVYACSFYVMLHAHGHLHLIWIWPLPVSLLLLDRWFDAPRRRTLALWLLVVLLEALTSWYLAVMVLVANVIMAGVLLATDVRRTGGAGWGTLTSRALWRRRMAQGAVATIVAMICAWPFARHYGELRSSADEAAIYSADLASYVVPPENTLLGLWWRANIDGRPGSAWGEQTLFIGWLALGLAAFGIAVLFRNRGISRRAWVFPILTLTAFLLSLGPDPALLGGSTLAPFRWLSELPGFAGLRAPARFGVLVSLGVAGLAAIGAGALVRGLRRPAGYDIVAAAVPLMLMEWFVVDFPAGKPVPHAVPAIYRVPEIQTARSIVSLPEYRGTPEWFRGADYLLYSTAHWRPIVNGFGRAAPADHDEVLRFARAFPSNAAAMKKLGIQYVVVHGSRYPDGAESLIAEAQATTTCRLVTRIGSDYLFEILGE